MITEEELVPISALQHMLYCPRQCALIHIEQQWAENRLTAEGRVLHERADSGERESRGNLRVERRVALHSFRIGVTGIADVVEIRAGNVPYPVEYKRGRPKPHRADEVQLCAQAICLEEMLGVPVLTGALYYGKNRRRQEIDFDPVLRSLTERIASDTRKMLATRKTPPPEYLPEKCDNCSLKELCQPTFPRNLGTVDRWLAQAIEAD